MGAATLLLISLVVLVTAYFTWGSAVGRWLGIDPSRTTPAHTLRDDVDYVPARPSVLLGHHFASIAGAAPIIGPVTAVAFGWLPVLVWILVGVVFIGAVHDLSSLVASLRHEGKSIGEIIGLHIGYTGRTLFLLFSLSTLILVVAVFAIVVAKTFVTVPAAATASVFFLVLAVGFGLAINRFGVGLGPASAVGVPLLFGGLWLGQAFPLVLSFNIWLVVLFAYVFVASVTPVWVLLQPRDYLNSFLLYALLGLGVLAVIVARPEIQAPAITTLHVEGLGTLFPVLFVTVACGAISGFHSLVASGTTAKQLDSEAHAQPIAYGGMLIEALLAVLALVAVICLVPGDYQSYMTAEGGGAVVAFSAGLGGLMTTLGLPMELATRFVALAVSAFALTSLDTATRLSRFATQELLEPPRSRASTESWLRTLSQNRYAATTVPVVLASALAYTGNWKAVWPLFGSANQLLAALALLAVSAWLARRGRSNNFVRIPMVFMFIVTCSSLGMLAWTHLTAPEPAWALGGVALLLLGVALVLVGLSFRVLFLTPEASR